MNLSFPVRLYWTLYQSYQATDTLTILTSARAPESWNTVGDPYHASAWGSMAEEKAGGGCVILEGIWCSGNLFITT